LREYGYESNLPAGVTFNDAVPAAADFEDAYRTREATNSVVPVDDSHAIYLYERCVPSDEIPPSYVIIYGRYFDPDNTDANYTGDLCYYKIDLMDDDGYYPIYRNFCYRIIIRSILRKGQDTPAEAAAAAGSADVSADITTQHISEVSDGYARLAIDPWMSHTFIDEIDRTEDDPVLFTKLVIDDADPGSASFSAEVIPLTDGSPDIIRNVTFGAVREDGWVPVLFDLKRPRDPDDPTQTIDATKTQTLRIIGNYTKTSVNVETHTNVTTSRRLYRDVIITLQKRQEMRVRCQNHEVFGKIGESQAVDIWIPDGLVASMFPLEFTIEAEKSTLSPDLSPGRRPLPVKSGTSISDNPDYSGKQTFQYTCTLTWSDYLSLVPKRILDPDGSEHVWRIFTCHFVTTSRLNATAVYVANEYFVAAHDSFINVDPVEKFNYFYVAALGNCYLKLNRPVAIYYCHKIGGATLRSEWERYVNNTPIALAAGDTVWFKANELRWDEASDPYKGMKFLCYSDPANPTSLNGAFNVGGNIASLIVGEDFEESGKNVTGFSFTNFFKSHTGLVDASKLELPMRTLGGSAYKSLFDGCSGLLYAPAELPATTLASTCYRNMFLNCSSLKKSPVIRAASNPGNVGAFQRMFEGCTQLKEIIFLNTWYSNTGNNANFTDWVKNVPTTTDGKFYHVEGAAILGVDPKNNTAVPKNWERILYVEH
jgi:hypothetical protein